MNRQPTQSQIYCAYRRSGGKCAICGTSLSERYHIDHIKPFSKGGATDIKNLQAVCAPCNLKKGSKYEEV
jgi:5-methylcytosine-specific restriction endonuclease McrA